MFISSVMVMCCSYQIVYHQFHCVWLKYLEIYEVMNYIFNKLHHISFLETGDLVADSHKILNRWTSFTEGSETNGSKHYQNSVSS
jgi:hypothetical protein